MPRVEILTLLTELGFIPHPGKDNLFSYKDLSTNIGGQDYPMVAFVDFRKNEKGRRFATVIGKDYEFTDEELNQIEPLRAFKEKRDQIMGIKEETPKEKNVSVIPHQTQPKDVKNAPETKNIFKTGKQYNVSGKSTPDAALTQQNANNAGISITILEATQDRDYAHVEVRASLPSGQFVEDCVHHDFNLMKDVIMMDLINEMQKKNQKIVIESDDQGRPVLSGELQKRLYERWIRMKYFSLRDAITKATRRAQMKLLNAEWRENDEITSEAMEENMIHKNE